MAGASKAADCCAYKCKTCRRTFPSFQALGGHRSSHTHKNTAITATALDHKPISSTSPANKQHEQRFNYNNNVSNQLDQVRMSRSDYYNNFKSSNNHKIKVHECSVCGADFISGQALGGHMRRHRRGCGGTSRDSSEIDRRCSKKQRSNLWCLDLNLNLPAPENDKRENLGVAMGATNLVDCHYWEHWAFLHIECMISKWKILCVFDIFIIPNLIEKHTSRYNPKTVSSETS